MICSLPFDFIIRDISWITETIRDKIRRSKERNVLIFGINIKITNLQ